MHFTEDAPAKLNLSLHVVGRREDGYHLLESAVTFLSLADRISCRSSISTQDTFNVYGPYADMTLPLSGNSVVKVLELYRTICDIPPVDVTLQKKIPVQAGLGGGSSDAAAMIRGLSRYYPLSDHHYADIALQCGADVPVCLTPEHDAMFFGIGESCLRQDSIFLSEHDHILICYPRGCGAATPDVFKRYKETHPVLDTNGNHPLSIGTNDLTGVAAEMLPVIGHMLDILGKSNASHHGMSGSGSAVFGIFPHKSEALKAASVMQSSTSEHRIECTLCRRYADNAVPSADNC